jgi:uncharacterized membrane protein YfcA
LMSFTEGSAVFGIWSAPIVAFVISALTSMGGVSGAFLLLPFQMSVLGISSPSVSATNQLFNVVAIPSGVYRYVQEGRMVWPLTWVVVVGTLPGVLLGALVRVQYLPDPGHFKLFVAAVLLYIGVRMARDLLRRQASRHPDAEERFHASVQDAPSPEAPPTTRVLAFTLTHLEYEFQHSRFRVSNAGIFLLCFIVGIVGGIYGIGGGSIVAPFFVTVFRLPVYTVAGAALMGTFVTSIAGVVVYQLIAPFYPHLSVAPSWTMGLLFGVGGAAGMYVGARFQKRVPARRIKWMLAAIILFTSVRYVWGFVATFAEGGHVLSLFPP